MNRSRWRNLMPSQVSERVFVCIQLRDVTVVRPWCFDMDDSELELLPEVSAEKREVKSVLFNYFFNF